jgi:hypothetical protein
MAPADHPYRVRPASADDLPAVLSILAEAQAAFIAKSMKLAPRYKTELLPPPGLG